VTPRAERFRRLIRYYYPITAAYLCVMVTLIVLLLLLGSPIEKCDC
jgi:hypothetical protein